MMGNAPERIFAWVYEEGSRRYHVWRGKVGPGGDGQTEYVRADLAPAPSVRKLEWIHCADGTWHDAHCQYELETDGGYWRVTKGVTGGASYLCDTATIEAAKAAAQADYEARILAALSPPEAR